MYHLIFHDSKIESLHAEYGCAQITIIFKVAPMHDPESKEVYTYLPARFIIGRAIVSFDNFNLTAPDNISDGSIRIANTAPIGHVEIPCSYSNTEVELNFVLMNGGRINIKGREFNCTL